MQSSKSPSRTPTDVPNLPPKLAIPRFHVDSLRAPSGKRAARACERCRQLKRKCTAAQPCTTCNAEGKECIYTESKREIQKRGLAASQQREDLLTGLVNRANEEKDELLTALRSVQDTFQNMDKHPSLTDILSRYEESEPGRGASSGSEAHSRTTPMDDQHPITPGENMAPVSVGSPGSHNPASALITLGQGSGAAGFIGKFSSISWLERARHHILQRVPRIPLVTHTSNTLAILATTDMNYHVNEAELLSVNEDSVDEYQWPAMAAAMVGAFSDCLYPAFPFVDKVDFWQQFPEHLLGPHPHQLDPVYGDNRRWLAMMNMVFCLGSMVLYQTGAYDLGGQDDHLLFYARARKLGLDHRVIFDHPSVEHVQMLGLLGLYLVSNHQIARAWTTVGNAIRHATALAMHLAADPTLQNIRKDRIRSKTWYALYNLEMYLVGVTGRPTSLMSEIEMTAPMEDLLEDVELGVARAIVQSPLQNAAYVLPDTVPLSKPQSLSDHFFRRIKVSVLSRKVSTELYAPGLHGTWAQFQNTVCSVELTIEELLASLSRPIQNHDFPLPDHRQDMEFAMSIHSLQMNLYRPFLCDWDGRIRDESGSSQTFNQSKAVAAITAARSMLAILPNPTNIEGLRCTLPWWSLLHYICQAGAILLLELSLNAVHLPFQSSDLVIDVQRVVAYLQTLSSESLSALRAWQIYSSFLPGLETFAGGAMDVDTPQPF